MTYRKIAFLLFFIGGFGILNAQDIIARLDLGKRDPKPEFYEYSPVDKGLVTLGPATRTSNRYLSLRKYDSNLKEQWSERILEQNGRKNVDFVSVIGPYVLVFVSEFFPGEGVIKTYYYQYDLEGNQIADEALLSVYPNQKEQKVELQYVLSPNKRRLLAFKNLENRRDSEQILFYQFDETGEFILNGEINLRYPDNRFRVRTVRVSNQGNVFLLGKFFKAAVPKVKDNDDFQFLVYRYNAASQQGSEIAIDLGSLYITDLAFRLDRFENVYVAGFYSNLRSDRIGGTILQKISPAGELLLNATEKFDAGFLGNYLSSGQINRGKELRNFYLKDIILRSDGGVLLLAEKFYITYQSYRDYLGYWVDREIYHYEDVILTSIAGSGNIEWHAIVEKNQVSENNASSSYFNAISPGGTFLFYEYKPRGKGINIYYNVVDIEGNVKGRRPLLPDYRFGNEYYPRYSEQISNNEALMVYFSSRGRRLSVVKVAFDKS